MGYKKSREWPTRVLDTPLLSLLLLDPSLARSFSYPKFLYSKLQVLKTPLDELFKPILQVSINLSVFYIQMRYLFKELFRKLFGSYFVILYIHPYGLWGLINVCKDWTLFYIVNQYGSKGIGKLSNLINLSYLFLLYCKVIFCLLFVL